MQEHYLIQKNSYQEINVWEDESKRAEMLKKSGGRTLYLKFFGDHHVGGNAELQAANKSGELDKLLA